MKRLMGLLAVMFLIDSFSVCAAEEIIPLGIITPMPEELVFTFAPGVIQLREGWNLVTMPVLPGITVTKFISIVEGIGGPIPMPDGTMREIAGGVTWTIPVVAVYKNGKFKALTKETGNYNMVSGEAYFVYAVAHQALPPDATPPQRKVEVSIGGEVPNLPVSLNLDKGWNGVGLSAGCRPGEEGIFTGKPRIYNIGKLIEELKKQTVPATRLIFWNAEQQAWEQYDLTTKEALVDRNIQLYEGFFVACSNNGLYIPGLGVNQEGPHTPIPPPIPEPEVRVSYTGRIEGIFYIPECKPPYDYVIMTGDKPEDRVPIRGKYVENEQDIAKAAQTEGKYLVEGVMRKITYYDMFAEQVIDLKTGETTVKGEYTVDVLMVDNVKDVSDVRVSYEGKIEGIACNVTDVPGKGELYHFLISVESLGHGVGLRSTNQAIERLLTQATETGGSYRVEGLLIEDCGQEILIVDKVELRSEQLLQ